ncbi:MAG: class I SAM-dependent methyltransferase [Candidatus Pacebacteria bacterium]|nr:class I SAM-dependent methyltransferase [Candidatus Paceibacterota bacterium]MDD3919035.1 class I SAM-dependent methyltransferase [Candidatus Paceibacterota bacterium]
MHKSEKILIKTYTDYNAIADKFSSARKNTWPEFDFLFSFASKGKRVLDLGCGNGRFYEKLKEENYTGVDNSEKLIKIAKEKYPKADFKVASALELPFDNEEFDLIYSLAVLHHLPKDYHNIFVQEAKRVLKKNGILILTIWNLQERKEKQDVKKISEKEILIPWHGAEDHYFYVFDLEELKNLFKDFTIIEEGEIKIKKFSNYYLILKKNG